jgi:hypothetical protein
VLSWHSADLAISDRDLLWSDDGGYMFARATVAAVLLAGLGASALPAQVPPAFGPLQPPSALGVAQRDAVVEMAGGYRLIGFQLFGRDSALLVFDDSTLTDAALRANTWMFGPPVTTAEADGCPPEKVLGRRIARVFWAGWGRPAETQHVMVAVRGTIGRDRWTAVTMYYLPSQLDGPWAGDRHRRIGAP